VAAVISRNGTITLNYVLKLVTNFAIRARCCRALKLPTMPSLSMHTKHGVLRRRDDGVLDVMAPHLQRGNGGH